MWRHEAAICTGPHLALVMGNQHKKALTPPSPSPYLGPGSLSPKGVSQPFGLDVGFCSPPAAVRPGTLVRRPAGPGGAEGDGAGRKALSDAQRGSEPGRRWGCGRIRGGMDGAGGRGVPAPGVSARAL